MNNGHEHLDNFVAVQSRVNARAVVLQHVREQLGIVLNHIQLFPGFGHALPLFGILSGRQGASSNSKDLAEQACHTSGKGAATHGVLVHVGRSRKHAARRTLS
jgi:hypothetical protein